MEFTPRQACFDDFGALHHLFIRESTGGLFFTDDSGRENFFERLQHDRSAVIQAAQRENNDPELRAAASIMEQLKGKVKQR